MSSHNIKANYTYNVVYQVLLLLTPLITTPYVSRVLGADGIGEYSFANSITQYFVVAATMGVTTFGQREISYTQDDRQKRSNVFWETKLLTFFNVAVSFIIYIFFVAMNHSNNIIFLILGLNILNVVADITWFFQGMEQFKKIVIRNIAFKFLDVVFIFSFVKDKSDLPIYVFGIVFFIFLGNISMWGYLPKYIDRPNIKIIRPFRNIKVIWSLFIPTIAMQIYTVLDKTMIGIIVEGSFENGYYEQAMKISKMVLTLVTSLGSVMIPRIGFLFEKKDIDSINSYMYRVYNFVFFLSIPLCFGLIGISNNFVPWFFGDGYSKVTDLLKVSGFLIIAIGLSNVTGLQYLVPTKRQNMLSLSLLCGAVINFVLNIILIRIYQSIGAIIASAIAEFCITGIQFYIVRRELNINKINRLSWNYFVSGIVMYLVIISVSRILEASMVNTLLLIALGSLVYFGILFIMRDQFFIFYTHKCAEEILERICRTKK